MPRRAVEGKGPPVVAEALPLADHVGGRCDRELFDPRPALEPPLPARQHALDLRLLGHDLADEDRVRVARPPPRQVASVLHEPRQEQILHGANVARRGASRRRHHPADAPHPRRRRRPDRSRRRHRDGLLRIDAPLRRQRQRGVDRVRPDPDRRIAEARPARLGAVRRRSATPPRRRVAATGSRAERRSSSSRRLSASTTSTTPPSTGT